MMFKRVNRDSPEQVFIVVRNSEGATINADQTVQWEVASASVDGVRVRDMDTGNLWAFAGVADASIANGEYGPIQIYGYRSTALVHQSGTSIDTGVPLVPVAGSDCFSTFVSTTASNAAVTLQPTFAVLLESITDATASSNRQSKVFLRAM